ncbi:MAG TPA: hypothetical protein VMJ64_02090 [Anaerolineales bacterium]|nr:hypothetical protein [Anaerolineales bacterium]
MTATPPRPAFAQPERSVLEWLLDSDPSIRWQALRDLTDAPAQQVTSERARVATEGLGAKLLSLQGPDGSWGGTAWNRGWDSTMHVLSLLREMGLDPAGEPARRAVQRVVDGVRWQGWDWDGAWRGKEFVGNPFFAGEVEPCINGQVGASAAYFGQDLSRVLDWLLRGQLEDGGWNCEAENGSTRSSFNTTICVLEALLEYELAGGTRAGVREARLRGQEYLLERRLLRRKSTGDLIERAWSRFSFPNWWHYDVLRGLDYMRKVAVVPDDRLREAVELVASKRGSDGRWLLENQYPGTMPVDLGEAQGHPSRWITLRALRVLKWYSAEGG